MPKVWGRWRVMNWGNWVERLRLIGTFAIMIILIAVLGLVVVNAMKHSPWATFTVSATIPIAMIVGVYMRHFRPGKYWKLPLRR